MCSRLIILLCLFVQIASAQQPKVIRVAHGGPAPTTLLMNDPTIQDWHTALLNVHEAPKHTAPEIEQKKEYLESLRRAHTTTAHSNADRAGTALMPIIAKSFTANGAQNTTPLDNTMAISNGGKILSCVNTELRVMDTTGATLFIRSLSALAPSITGSAQISDPRVMYDPDFDRFILLFFYGSTSKTNNIVVGFSTTNDPTGKWNYYKLPGNLLNDTTWSDYPILSLSQYDLFVTFNHLVDGKGWKDGFRYSVIWQIDKLKGYNADSLEYNYWHNIQTNNKPIWNICPVQDGAGLSSGRNYFLSVRPSDLTNDSLFLTEISDSYQSGTATLSTRVIKTNVAYGLSPNAHQHDGQQLATNDARILSAIIYGSTIQYVQNSIAPAHLSAGVYWGTISGLPTTPTATGQIIGYDTIDLGYPSIGYIGKNGEARSIMTCSYLSKNGYPGTAAFYRATDGTLSKMLKIIEGTSYVNILIPDTIERWGDYSGIQRMYNDPSTIWLAGSYTNSANYYLTVIAHIRSADTSYASGIHELPASPMATIYPNPTFDMVHVSFEMAQSGQAQLTLYDAMGRVVRTMYEDRVKAGTNVLSFSTQYLTAGSYWLGINTENGEQGRYAVIIGVR